MSLYSSKSALVAQYVSLNSEDSLYFLVYTSPYFTYILADVVSSKLQQLK
jgi:hypothetical protein